MPGWQHDPLLLWSVSWLPAPKGALWVCPEMPGVRFESNILVSQAL